MKKEFELTLKHAATAAIRIKRILLHKKIYDFKIVIGGSVVTKACGWQINRSPQDIDLRVYSANDKTLERIKQVLLKHIERGFLSQESIQFENIICLKLNMIDVDILLTNIDPPVISDVQYDDFELMKPIEIYQDKAHITDPKIALKTIGDCNRMILLLSKIIEDATDSAKLK